MVKKYAMVMFLASFLAGCVTSTKVHSDTAIAGQNSLKIVSISPSLPATLKLGERLTITIDYSIASSTDGVNIFARPYTGGKRTPGYSAHPSPCNMEGNGRIEGWFFFDEPATVDEVRINMKADGNVLATLTEKIEAQWHED